MSQLLRTFTKAPFTSVSVANDDLYRTPQNTPANNAPISSHAQQPGVSSIKEGAYIFLLLVQPAPC